MNDLFVLFYILKGQKLIRRDQNNTGRVLVRLFMSNTIYFGGYYFVNKFPQNKLHSSELITANSNQQSRNQQDVHRNELLVFNHVSIVFF